MPTETERRPRRELSELPKADQKVRAWILAHRGALTLIAETCSVSHQFVQQIAYGRSNANSRGLRVERMLHERGCPGIKVR